MPLQAHQTDFKNIELRHLAEIRQQRRKTWADETLDPLDRVTLGLTGSTQELIRRQYLASTVASLIGRPLVIVEHVSSRGVVERASGGIIASKLLLEAGSRFDMTEGRGHAELAVALDHSAIFSGRELTSGRPSITLSHLVYSEPGNDSESNLPAGDFIDRVDPDSLLLGRPAIYGSPYFATGLSRLLGHIEEIAATAVHANP